MWRIAVVVIVGAIMSVLDTTIVNVALHDLSLDLHASLVEIQWVITGYLLSLAAVIPVTGWAVRRYSARRLYLIALVLFTVGSALCALAAEQRELIAFRVLQGVGGGMLTPIGQMILVKAAGPHNLPKVMSADRRADRARARVRSHARRAAAAGARLAVDLPDQRADRHPRVRARLAAAAPGPRRHAAQAGRLDVIGLVLAAAGTVGITYGLSESETAGSLTAPSVLVPVLAGLALLGAFVARSRASSIRSSTSTCSPTGPSARPRS